MRLSLQFAKITVFVSITAMFLLIYQFKSDLVYYNFNLNGRLGSSENNLKYILLWTYPKDEPLVSIGFKQTFENSFSEDYVTEKLLIALKNNAIPVVYGGANYTRFMPDGMYLNARTLGPKQLALQMDSLIKNPDKYADYFRWKNHYSYHINHESPETDNVCSFCKLLNDEKKFSEKSVVKNFRTWWDFPKFC
nr:alpha-(1,3)-fucosyltransferase C-like isoform X2 [Plodia interpunctella]